MGVRKEHFPSGMPADVHLFSRPRSLSRGKGKKKEDDSVEHPLYTHGPKTPSFSSSFDGTLTRPNLRRQVRGGSLQDTTLAEASTLDPSEGHARSQSDSGLDDWISTPGASSSASTTSEVPPAHDGEDTREVVVHQVQATDSLAGVALKYGVKIAALRKANKLWPSDSIHIRKVLYIPVDWQRQRRSKPTPIPIVEIDEHIEHVPSPSYTYTYAYTPTLSPSKSRQPQDRTSSGTDSIPTTQRIPTTEFSFFPSRPSLFSDLPPSDSPSSEQDSTSALSYSSMTLPVSMSSSRLGLGGRVPVPRIGVFNVFNSLAQVSTESLASLTRTSISDEVGETEVELQFARETWRNTPPNLTTPTLGSQSRARSDTNGTFKVPEKKNQENSGSYSGSNETSTVGKSAIRNTQPVNVAPMAIPTTPIPTSTTFDASRTPRAR